MESTGEPGSERVLIVDSDELAKGTLERRLRRRGFQALGIGTVDNPGASVLDHFDSIALAIIDLDGPRCERLGFIAEFRLRFPTTPVIAIASSLPKPVCAELERLNVAKKRWLSKPYRFNVLLAAVRDALDEWQPQRSIPSGNRLHESGSIPTAHSSRSTN